MGFATPATRSPANTHLIRSCGFGPTGAAPIVERLERWHALDHAAERHELGGDREHHERGEDTVAGTAADVEHHREAEHAAHRVGAGIAEHHALAQIVAE